MNIASKSQQNDEFHADNGKTNLLEANAIKKARSYADSLGLQPGTSDYRNKVHELRQAIMRGEALPAVAPRPSRPVIDQFMAGGQHGVIWGESNAGKSFLAISMGCAVALGKPWIGQRTNPGHVFYFDMEGSSADKRVRGIELAQNGGEAISRFHIITVSDQLDVNITVDERRAALLKEIRTLSGGEPVSMIIFDTFAATMANCTTPAGDQLEENSSGAGQRMANALKDLAVALNCAALFVHHPGKDPSKGMRGSSALRASIEFEYSLTIPDRKKRNELNLTVGKKRNGGIQPGAVVGLKMRVTQLYTASELVAYHREAESLWDAASVIPAHDWALFDDSEPAPPELEVNPDTSTLTLINRRYSPWEEVTPEKGEKAEKPIEVLGRLCDIASNAGEPLTRSEALSKWREAGYSEGSFSKPWKMVVEGAGEQYGVFVVNNSHPVSIGRETPAQQQMKAERRDGILRGEASFFSEWSPGAHDEIGY
jgi:hypothetical protein